jgi:type II secretory pathway component PulF
MSLFHYRAFNAAGETISGALEADSLTTLEARLRGAEVWLLDAREGDAAAEDATPKVSRLKVPRRDLIAFFVQMSLLLRSGITLPNALDRLAEDFEDTRMGTVLAAVAEKVALGTPLHQAMETYPRIFSRQVVAMAQAGEISGRMPEVFQSLSDYFEWMDHLMSDVRQALIYPIIVTTAALALVLMLFTFIVPRFVGLLTDLSIEVPPLTRVVMAISHVLVRGWPVIVALAFGAPIALRIALRSPRFSCAFDRALMRIPIFGPLVQMFALARFTHNLGMLYRAGIPLLRGLEISQNLVGNRAIEVAIDDVRRGVLEGTPMSKSLAKHDEFPSTLVTMIATGEQSGHLDVALQSVSEYYNTLIPRRIKVVFAVFNPVVMLTLIAIVGVVALSVILPILQLWTVR